MRSFIDVLFRLALAVLAFKLAWLAFPYVFNWLRALRGWEPIPIERFDGQPEQKKSPPPKPSYPGYA